MTPIEKHPGLSAEWRIPVGAGETQLPEPNIFAGRKIGSRTVVELANRMINSWNNNWEIDGEGKPRRVDTGNSEQGQPLFTPIKRLYSLYLPEYAWIRDELDRFFEEDEVNRQRVEKMIRRSYMRKVYRDAAPQKEQIENLGNEPHETVCTQPREGRNVLVETGILSQEDVDMLGRGELPPGWRSGEDPEYDYGDQRGVVSWTKRAFSQTVKFTGIQLNKVMTEAGLILSGWRERLKKVRGNGETAYESFLNRQTKRL